MAQRGSWTDLSRKEVSSPSLACRSLSRARSASQTDLMDLSPSSLEATYFDNPSKFRLAVKPGLGLTLENGPRSSSAPSGKLSDNHLDSPEGQRLVSKKRTFSRAKDSMKKPCDIKGNNGVPLISITDESDSGTESTLNSAVSSPQTPETTGIENPACIVNFTSSSVTENVNNPKLDFMIEKKLDHNDEMRLEIPEGTDEAVRPNGDVTPGNSSNITRTVKKVPVITDEMLQKHSYHYYLMHNFFLSESSSSGQSEDEGNQESPETPTVKKVTFNLEPEVITLEPDTPSCSCLQRNPAKYAYIQVAGTMFQTHWTTLDRHPDTLLGRQDKFQYYDYSREVFNFPHIRQDCFESILFYYQDGILRSPKGVKEEVFLAELDFFGIRHDKITVGPFEHELQDNYDHAVPEQDSFQARVFLFLYHKSSTATKIYTFVDIIFILTSVVSFLTATIPKYKPPLHQNNSGNWTEDQLLFYSRFGAIKEFVIIDGTCMTWFFAMFILRYYAAPRKQPFLKSFQSGIDLILITAFVISVALAYSPVIENSFLHTLVRLTFSLRILKLSQHSLLLNSLGIALKEASKELISVLLFVFVIVFIFACFEYFVEIEEPSKEPEDDDVNCDGVVHSDCQHHLEKNDEHTSLMDYVWWSLITITTIGYGNTRIYTTAGKVVGALCAISGVPLFAIPIPILSKHLERVYQRELRRNKLLNHKMKLLSQRMLTESTSPNTDLIPESEDSSDSEETISWQKIVGTRRKSMGPQFAMTHFSNNAS